MNDEELDRLIAQERGAPELPGPLQDELWVSIESQIRPRRARALAPWLAAAAIVLSVGVALLNSSRSASVLNPAARMTAGLPSSGTWAAADEAFLPAEDDLQAAVQDLQQAYARRRVDLDPSLLAVYDENLELVGSAVEHSRAALVQHPGDPHLQRMLRHAYDQQLSLLVRATGVHP